MNRGRFNENYFIELNLETLLESTKSLDIRSIGLDTTLTINDRTGYFVDKEHPIAYSKFEFWVNNQLIFEKEYYLEHKEEIDKILIEYLKNYSRNSFAIHDCEAVDKGILKALAANPNIQTITLGTSDSPFILTPEVVDLFKDSSITSIYTDGISPELKEDFRPIIGYNARRPLIQSCDYQSLQELEQLNLYQRLPDEQIKNLKYLKKGCKVRIGYSANPQTLDIIKELIKLDPERQITIDLTCDDKNKFTKEILESNIEGLYEANIMVDTLNLDTINLKKYIDYESRLYKMIEPAIGLSPLEKYLFAYNVVKKFKPYKENTENLQDSRDLYRILEGDYMVCVGYAHLLDDLLEKLGIKAREYHATVSTTFDGISNEERIAEEDKMNYAGHAREEVYICDPKYGIDGIYICDPTWDNDMEHDFYNFALITHENYNKIYRENSLSFDNIYEVFFSSSIEEFYSKANLWMNKNLNHEERQNPEGSVLRNIKNELRKVNRDIYIKLCDINPRFKKGNYIPTGKSKTDFLNFVSSYIIHNNQIHPGTLSQHLGHSSYKDLFNASTTEEFYKAYYDKISTIKQSMEPIEQIFITAILGHLELLDPEFTNQICDKYHIIKSNDYSKESNLASPDYIGAITAIGEYIVEKVNRKVEGSTLRGAITEIYRKCYGISEDELESKISEVFEENAQRHEKTYPTRMAIMPDNTTYPYKETENVFEGKGR